MRGDRELCPKPPFLLGPSQLVLLGLTVAFVLAWLGLGLQWGDLWPDEGGLKTARAVLGKAFSPALEYQSPHSVEGTPPLWLRALTALGETFVFALAAMGLALIGGLGLGFLGSSAWWDPNHQKGPIARLIRRSAWVTSRSLIVGLRSIHELLWALLFLLALGLVDAAAILAIALPYAGYLGKVFSDLLDEAPRDAADALREIGASPLQVFFMGLAPLALPDLLAYAFYRLECALRSSAILGFFGYPTIGLYIRQSFFSGYYAEVWTYLWILILAVVIFDRWSAALRMRLRA